MLFERFLMFMAQTNANNEFKGNNRYLTPLFCRDLCYYLIRKHCYFSKNRAMPL